jgi:hypothetical protein
VSPRNSLADPLSASLNLSLDFDANANTKNYNHVIGNEVGSLISSTYLCIMPKCPALR